MVKPAPVPVPSPSPYSPVFSFSEVGNPTPNAPVEKHYTKETRRK